MTIAVLVMTDGRVDCLAATIDSLEANVSGDVAHRYIWDDTGDDDHLEYLTNLYLPRWTIIRDPRGRQGFGGAIRGAWSKLVDVGGFDHLFHVEDDFVFQRPVDLDAIATVLDDNPHLAQVALVRQAWNEAERLAGGVVELNADQYADVFGYQARWLEHRLFWTTNPSLMRVDVLRVGWPEGDHSEGLFTHKLLTEGFGGVSPGAVRFAYWGARGSGPWVQHIGTQRAGTGY